MTATAEKNEIYSGNRSVDAVYRTAEWLLSAFAGVLVFIIFVMQVYRIPTGSMAPTLRGAHFRVRCAQCGYAYGHDFIAQQYDMPDTFTPSWKLPIMHEVPTPSGAPQKFLSSVCPNCGYDEPPLYRDATGYYTVEYNRKKPPHFRTVFKGDQIFVLKSIYQFFQPKRWDVIVFKNPVEPRINYIKRCVGLPNETIQMVDGDVYADGIIQRKPHKVQEELWMVVYNNDYRPVRPDVNRFNGRQWLQPFERIAGSAWKLDGSDPKTFELDTDHDVVQRIRYNDNTANGFRATYAYDDPRTYDRMPVCSDLMVRYYLDIQPNSAAGAQIRKHGVTYQGWIYADGTMQINRLTPGGQPVSLVKGRCPPEKLKETVHFRFSVVDRRIVLEAGPTAIRYDLGPRLDELEIKTNEPEVQIIGYGKLRLAHIGIFRDIYYISESEVMDVLRGTRQNPMVLGEDQFFACGDNSPYSSDSRIWETPGLGNNGKTYPPGVVPKEYLVGKGMVVHWPGGYRLEYEPLQRIPLINRLYNLRWIPNVDDMKVIYGGKDE